MKITVEATQNPIDRLDQDRKHRLDILCVCMGKRLGKPSCVLSITMLQCISVSVRHTGVIVEKNTLVTSLAFYCYFHLVQIKVLY